MGVSYENVGSTIKRIREAKKLTQSQLSELSGLSRSYLGSIEINSNNPSFEALKKISNALGVSVNVFLNDSTELKEIEDAKLNSLILYLIRNTEDRLIKWEPYLQKQTPFDNCIANGRYEAWQEEGMAFASIKDKFYLLHPVIVDVLPEEDEKVEYKFYILSIIYYDRGFKILELGSSKDFSEIDHLYKLANPELMGRVNLLDDLLSEIRDYEIENSEVPF